MKTVESNRPIQLSGSCIEDAYRRIRHYIHRTAVHRCSALDTLAGCHLYFKCENFQKGGAFKIRGATNAALSLDRDTLKKGIATHSSGNHAQAVALTASRLALPAYVVMPSNAPKVKVAAVRTYGAEIIFCAPTLQSREETLQSVIERTGAAFIHPYDNHDVICGQGTCAYEFLQQVPDIDVLVAPVGGGGLLGGTALAANWFRPGAVVFGAEPEGADDAFRSLKAGRIIPSEHPDTIADGLLTSLGARTFPILQKYLKAILTVSDVEIIEGMRLIWERMKLVVEPSAAVPLAAVLRNQRYFTGRNVGIILSGGNVDLSALPW